MALANIKGTSGWVFHPYAKVLKAESALNDELGTDHLPAGGTKQEPPASNEFAIMQYYPKPKDTEKSGTGAGERGKATLAIQQKPKMEFSLWIWILGALSVAAQPFQT
eukprot:TRINITY_DN104292_c0_g1_i1.p2 TRINITY_DN104292_c0_g1~~TRINITY_DN104292_c0_g1_i1.p2  ORF type:complete len:108 (-),score=23.69 TRINITY_DN104292_c0_g1_i1:170-493(-)